MSRALQFVGSALPPRSARAAFWTAAAAAAAFGLFVVWALAPLTGVSRGLGGTAHDGFFEIARSLGAGRGFVFGPGEPPELHRPPLYPLLIAPLTLLPHGGFRPALILLQSAMLGALAWMLFGLTELLFGTAAARRASLLLLLYPWAYWHAKNPMAIMLQAALYFALAYAAIWLFLRQREDEIAVGKTALGLGAILGVAMLSHATMLASGSAIVILLAAAALARKRRRLAGAAALSLLVAAALVAPWTCRNWRVAGAFIPVAANSGLGYFAGNAHWAIGAPGQQPGEDEIDVTLRHAGLGPEVKPTVRFFGTTDPALSRELDRRMKAHARAHPGLLLKKMTLNLIDDYCPTLGDVVRGQFSLRRGAVWENLALSLLHLALWAAVVAGFVRARRMADAKRRWVRSAALVAAVGIYVFPYLPFLTYVSHAQYTFGTMPFLFALTADALTRPEGRAADEPR